MRSPIILVVLSLLTWGVFSILGLGLNAANATELPQGSVTVVSALNAQGGAASASKPKRTYSKYVRRTIDAALKRGGFSQVDNADGKRIESVEIVRFEIIEENDAAPVFLNWFHATTRRNIVQRELLLAAGFFFDQRLSDETERNLRVLGLFSVVVSLPVAGSAPNSIRYLVITKDIWSLRAGWDGRFANGVVDRLSMRPSEINLFGMGRRVSGSLALTPSVIAVGIGAVEPRLGGTRLRVEAEFLATINCSTGGVEGYTGRFGYSRPLFSTRAHWAYSTTVSLSQGIRRLPGPQGRGLCRADNSGETKFGVDERDIEDPDKRYAVVPNEYTFDTQSFNQSFTRSFGRTVKTNISWGFSASRSASRAVDTNNIRLQHPDTHEDSVLTPSELEAGRNWYLRRVRPSTRQLSPFVQLVSSQNYWHRDIHAETFGLQESFRLGPVASLRLYAASEKVGSSRTFLGIRYFASYATRVSTGYAKAQISHRMELAGTVAESNSSLSMRLRFSSPRFRFGRFVWDQQYVRAHPNFSRSVFFLDNTFRLRGYRAVSGSSELYGTGYAVANLEFRTRPIHLLSTLLGAVAFYDAGDAFYEDDPIHIRHGAGLGIRFLMPQLDREVLRLDVGFPLSPGDPLGKMTINATFGQAFTAL